MIVLDEILDSMDAAKSGVVPGSVCQSYIPATQNVPKSIFQSIAGQNNGSAFTTLPLTNIKCTNLDKSYIHQKFKYSFTLSLTAKNNFENNKKYRFPLFIGGIDGAGLYSQVQILLDGSNPYNTTFQRQEAVLAYNSLPETEIRGNPQYSSIEKMRMGLKGPIKRVWIEFTAKAEAKTISKEITLLYNVETDLNRLNPLLSNVHFTTPHFGNLMLKLFYYNMEQWLVFCPDYDYKHKTSIASGTAAQLLNSPSDFKYFSNYSFSEFFGEEIKANKIPAFCYALDAVGVKPDEPILLESFTFSQPTTKKFFEVETIDMCQVNFEIREEEYRKLSDFYAAHKSIIIPSNTWRSAVFNGNPDSATDTSTPTWATTYTGYTNGYNIDFISVWSHQQNSPMTLEKEFLRDIQLQLDGVPLNPVNYEAVDERAITDFTQAIIDTDNEEINHDFINSLRFGNDEINGGYIQEIQKYYLNDSSLPADAAAMGAKCLNDQYLSNPNTFAMNWLTNLPGSFHTGKAVLENTTHTPTLRLFATGENMKAIDGASIKGNNNTFPYYPNFRSNKKGTNLGFSCFCDVCLVLTYDAAREKAFNAVISDVQPFE